MAADLRDLSRRLYAVLEKAGASESMRKLHQETSRVNEILETILMSSGSSRVIRAYRCGSSYEGSTTPATASDIDIVYGTDQMFPLVGNLAHAPPSLSLFMHRSDSTFPGYMKLHLLLDGQPITIAENDYLAGFGIDIEGNHCFKHVGTPAGNSVPNGPADALYDKRGRHVFDSVFSFRGLEIPHFATSWIKKSFEYKWPSSDCVTRMSQSGCMAVGVGYTYSGEREIEWRLSFTIQERQLMTHLNPVQHKVYILMKLIKTEFLNNEAVSEKITSYQCKTCIFHAARIYPEHLWTPENLIGCLFACMSILLQMIRAQYCPSFFVNDQNLLAKRGYRDSKFALVYILKSLLLEGVDFLFRIQSDSVGQMLLESALDSPSPSSEAKLLSDSVVDFKYTIYSRGVGIILNCLRGILKCIDSVGGREQFMSTLDSVKDSPALFEQSVGELATASSYIAPYLHLQLAIREAVQSLRCVDPRARLLHMQKCDQHLKKAESVDLLSAWLIRATILLRFQKFEDCLSLCRLLDEHIHRFHLYLCSCPGNPRDNTLTKIETKRALVEQNTGYMLQNHVTSCVVFRPCDMDIVPWPLRPEMLRSLGTPANSRDPKDHYWYDWVAVDARVYMFFLQYYASMKLNRRSYRLAAKESLMKMADTQMDCGHIDTKLNLQGWIHLQEGEVDQAVKCFARSWRIRPKHNAAKFHVLGIWNQIQ